MLDKQAASAIAPLRVGQIYAFDLRWTRHSMSLSTFPGDSNDLPCLVDGPDGMIDIHVTVDSLARRVTTASGREYWAFTGRWIKPDGSQESADASYWIEGEYWPWVRRGQLKIHRL
jgi:hypothetical protein